MKDLMKYMLLISLLTFPLASNCSSGEASSSSSSSSASQKGDSDFNDQLKKIVTQSPLNGKKNGKFVQLHALRRNVMLSWFNNRYYYNPPVDKISLKEFVEQASKPMLTLGWPPNRLNKIKKHY